MVSVSRYPVPDGRRFVASEPDGFLTRSRTTPITAGVLLIAATAASLVSTGLLNPLVNGSSYLTWTFAHQDRVIAGSFLLMVSAFTGAGVAIALYPALRRHAAGLAIGSVGFRVMEGVMYLVSAVAVLLLVTLSRDAATAGSAGYIQTSGSLLRALRDQASLAGILAFYLGAFMYYWIFFRSRLVPRWLASWGMGGVVLGFVAGMLVLFRATASMSAIQVGLNVPIGVNEMVLAVWLIVKGFNPQTLHEVAGGGSPNRQPVAGNANWWAPSPLRRVYRRIGIVGERPAAP
jgi:hypothetical protein